jgi:hypothetical protein
MAKLTLQGITHAGDVELVDGLISIGRNPTNDFRVSDPTVSSFHCELIISGETVLVRDLKSTNGTFIDQEQVQESFLHPGQILRLGEAELRLAGDASTPLEEVVVQIPEAQQKEPETHLLDGRPACVNHPGTEAVLRCTVCERVFCSECVKPLGLRGGQKRLFCPSCSQPCTPIGGDRPALKKRSFFGRLTQTIRIRLGQR